MPTQLPPKGHSSPIFGPCLLWPNGWMDQDATWYRGRTRFRPHCIRWVPAPTQKKGAQLPQPPLFGPCLLWPNSWMDRDATCDGGRPRPRRHCVSWRPSSPQKRAQSPIFGPCLLWTKRSPISATAEQLYHWLETYDFALVIKSNYKYIEPFQILVYK